jgi:Raf kinase inhibitor-like YbhB/YbcL family protein
VVKRTLGLLAAGLIVTGCGHENASAPEPTAANKIVRVTSPAFAEGNAIPATYTCSGSGNSPELHWSGVPSDAHALALVVDDPDAPGGTYTHWVVVDIPATTAEAAAGQPPAGGTELRGSDGPGWSPPCPPGGTHHYRFSVYALRSPVQLPGTASVADAMDAIGSATLAWGRLTGTVAASGGDGGY